jgi:hypothetical protein
VQERVSFQAGAGEGALNRRSPTGAAAKGIPLKTKMPFSCMPLIYPRGVLTIGSTCPDTEVHKKNEKNAATIDRENLVSEHVRFITAYQLMAPK